MSAADLELARALLDAADRIEKYRPLLTRAAQRLATLKDPTAVDNPCPRCGADVEQLERGRPRKFCPTCSPRKKAEKGKVAA